MIGKLSGIIDDISDDYLILDVQGVGYLVHASSNTLRNLPPSGRATLLIETHVREDRIQLFGFLTTEERYWFRTLNKITGCGVKTALAILSILTPDAIAMAVESEDKAPLARAAGVGPKLAARLITELKGVVKSFPGSGVQNYTSVDIKPVNDAVSALVSLGYGRSDAYNVITKIFQESDEQSAEFLIRSGLKVLGKVAS